MTSSRFTIGQAYYLLTFLDKDLQIPSIDAYIFLGRNILKEDHLGSKDDWCFQTAESYVSRGPYNPDEPISSRDLLLAGGDMIDEFLELSELIRKLQEIEKRTR